MRPPQTSYLFATYIDLNDDRPLATPGRRT